jgi:Copper type II ascorbate-dependent monooxygenase, C-terminal domain
VAFRHAPRMRKFAVLLAVFVMGCGSDGGSNTGDDTPIDAAGTPDASTIPDGYTRLVGRKWSLPAGATDTYRCIRFTVPAETYITNIVALAPAGTHHTVLSIAAGNAAGADGEYDCSVGSIGRPMLYASGVGTDPLDFPTNVGLKIPAGTQVHLNLHLFNATDKVLAGESAIYIKASSTPPPMLAEMVFAGKILFGIDPGMHDVIGGCTVQTPYTLFAYWPHMHKIARHSKLELLRGADPNPVITVLHDQAYDFNEQKYYKPPAEVSVLQGDRIRVTCSYDNPMTTGQIRFGDSTNDEMCFTGLYRYPSQNASITQCTDVPGGIPGG